MPPTTELQAFSPAIPVAGSLLRHFPTSVELPFGPITGSSISCPTMKVTALRFTETAGSRIAKTGGECLTFDQLALRAPLGQYTVSCFRGDEQSDTRDFWLVEIEGGGKTWKQDQRVRIRYVDTGGYLHSHDKKYTRIVRGQQEAMLFLNFSNEYVDSFKSKYREVAVSFRGNDLIFLIGDVDVSHAAFQYFGLKEDKAPLNIIQEQDAKKLIERKIGT